MDFENIKLKIEMVPQPLWNLNLRYLLKQKKWDQIRKRELKRVKNEKYQYVCEICKNPKDVLDCHEIWNYDDEFKIQTLTGLMMLCKRCHLIKHIGFATNLAMEGKCNFDNLIRHFCMINKLNADDFYDHYEQQVALWDERSKHKWTQDLKFITEYPIEIF